MRPPPYVGVSCFDSPDQVWAVRKALLPDRLLMVGGAMHGDARNWSPAPQWPKRTLSPEKLRQIFFLPTADNVLNLLHYTPAGGDLGVHLCNAHEVCGAYLHGMQLNTDSLPDIKALEFYRRRFPRSVLVIAARRRTVESLRFDPKRIGERLAEYDGVANYVMVDPSEGMGKEQDPTFVLRCFEEISARMTRVGLVAVGGLSADNVSEKLSPLARRFPIGTDAEGKLRTADDNLNVAETIRYVTTTDALLKKHEAQRKLQPVN